jgi:hypothetical protein
MTDNKGFLYRFRHLQGEHHEWTRQILEDSVLYFAAPPSFNDPFDCKVHYSNTLSVDVLRPYYTQLVKESLPHLNREQLRKKVAAGILSITPVQFISQMTAGMQEAANEIGVLSLSATCKSILLWSHYAACHTGICIKFHAGNTAPFFGAAQKVFYKEKYPEIDVLSNPYHQVEGFLLTKAKDWEYEEEWRIINHESGPGKKEFPDHLISEVILGARITDKDREDVLTWLGKRRCCVQVSQAVLSKGSYSLEIVPY